MPTLPQRGDQHDESKRIAVIVRIPAALDAEIEVACKAMGWKKQHFFEVAAGALLTRLTGKRKRGGARW